MPCYFPFPNESYTEHKEYQTIIQTWYTWYNNFVNESINVSVLAVDFNRCN